jgi:DNA excision repair protein ERCC-2
VDALPSDSIRQLDIASQTLYIFPTLYTSRNFNYPRKSSSLKLTPLKRILKTGVRDLVDHVLCSGDLQVEFFAAARTVEAIRAHQKIQKSRPADYRAEVPVSLQVQTDLFVLDVSGRIDGIYTNAERVCIEEIKTTTRNLDDATRAQNPIHWGQLKCYAYIYATKQSLSEIDIELTYCQLDSGEIRSVRQRITAAELAMFFHDLVSRYLQWAETIVRWGIQRDESIRALNFPYSRYRPGQRELAVAVYRTIKDGGHLLVQAATGIGKTMAVLFPAVKALEQGSSSKIFYLTARTTGRMAAQKALSELHHRGLRLKSLTITAKEKICFNPTNACHPDECVYARGHFDRLNEALTDIFRLDQFDRETIERMAQNHRVCPFEFSLSLSLWADCIVCDYNYAFDPRVFLRRFFLEENGSYIFLIDEAHNLVDRSREMFSAELFKQPVLQVRRSLRHELPAIFKTLGKINSWMARARKKCSDCNRPFYAEKKSPDDFFPILRNFLRMTERWLSRNLKTPFREELLALFFAVSGFLRVAEQYDESYATCFEKTEKDLKLKLFCIDPSGQLKSALTRCKTAVFFSATLSPMQYFRKILGCTESARQLMLPSPFPRQNLALFIADSVSTLYRQRENTKDQVARAIFTLIHQKKGNYLVFFPSYEYMLMVYECYNAGCPPSEVILQTPNMSEQEREAFLQRFALENPLTLVGFAVMGGIFGEGIDLVGDRLSGAVVVGVGLPGISLERELIREYFAVNLHAGFEYAYQFPGINRVFQAAGRVIRTETDRGVVLLIDQRYANQRYRTLLPVEWDPAPVSNLRHFAARLQSFWKP